MAKISQIQMLDFRNIMNCKFKKKKKQLFT